MKTVLKVYRFGRVLFGLKCSPFLLNGTVKVHVEKHVNHETRAFLEKFLRDLYVDLYELDSDLAKVSITVTCNQTKYFENIRNVLRSVRTSFACRSTSEINTSVVM